MNTFVRISILIFVLITNISRAGDEIMSVRVKNPKANSNLIVEDDKFYSPFGTWYNYYSICNNSSKAILELGFEEVHKHYHGTAFITTVTFNATALDKDNNPTYYNGLTLQIGYDPAKGTTYMDKNTWVLNNIFLLDVTVVSVVTTENGSVVQDPLDIYLEAKIHSTRDYNLHYFTVGSADAVNYTYLSASKELEVHWRNVPGAEEYELEWCWDHSYINGVSGAKYDFTQNATRVRTTNSYFRIPVIYEQGYIVYRVRPLGRRCADNTRSLVAEKWNTETLNIPDKGDISTLLSSRPHMVYQCTKFENDLFNWSSTVTFDENGKTGIGVALSDGLLKPHYTISRLNTEQNIIISSQLYDFQGRPAVQVLPVPLQTNNLGYMSNLNSGLTAPSTVGAFDKNLFDKDGTLCAPTTPKILTYEGASAYYSSNSGNSNLQSNKEGAQAYLPNAAEYPYSRVEYTPDNTGRIRSQSLPGEIHKTGSGKENRFFYGNPGDRELDRLFGNEAGHVSHYTKNAASDANGQISISYEDMQGRVVATALAGQNPSMLETLPNYASSTVSITDNLALKNTNTNYSREVSTSILVEEDGMIQQFAYEFTPRDFTSNCLYASNLCFNCIYEMELSIKDNCNAELIDLDPGTIGNQNTVIVGSIANNSIPCTASIKFTLPPLSLGVTFPKAGTYNVSKKLRVSTINIDKYWEIYKTNCLKSLDDIKTEQLGAIDYSSCNFTCAECSTAVASLVSSGQGASLTQTEIDKLYKDCSALCEEDPCAQYRERMLHDLTPSTSAAACGQYAQGGGNPTANSIFGGTGALGDYRNITFYNADGSLSTFEDASGNIIEAKQLSPADFIANFQESWANSLLHLHPEKCQLDLCENNRAGLKYSQDMLKVQTWDEACAAGFLRPLDNANSGCVSQNCPSCPSTVDPFFSAGGSGVQGGSGYQYLSQMNNELKTNYNSDASFMINISGAGWLNTLAPGVSIPLSGSASGECAYELASKMAGAGSQGFCSNSSSCDKNKIWQAFRTLYISKKTKMYEVAGAYCGTAPSGKVRIFTNATDLLSQGPQAYANSVLGGSAANPLSSTVPQQYLSNCTNYADGWMEKLVNCGATASNTSQYYKIRENLIAVCAYGSDANNPLGVSAIQTGGTNYASSPQAVSNFPTSFNHATPGTHYNTFAEVLAAHGSAACTGILSYPPAQGKADNYMNKRLDPCACSQIFNNEKQFTQGNLPTGVTTPEQLWNYYAVYGREKIGTMSFVRPKLENYNELKCACSTVYNSQTPALPAWSYCDKFPESLAPALAAYSLEIPNSITCCAPYDANKTALTNALNYVNTNAQFVVPANESDPDYNTALLRRQNYLNSTLGYNYSMDEYKRMEDVMTSAASTGIGTSSLPIETSRLQNFLNEQINKGSLLTSKSFNAQQYPSFVRDDIFNKGISGAETITYGVTIVNEKEAVIQLSCSTNTELNKTIKLLVPSALSFKVSEILSLGDMYYYLTETQTNAYKVNVSARTSSGLIQGHVLVTTNVDVGANPEMPNYGKSASTPCYNACNTMSLTVNENSCVQTLINQALTNASYLYQKQLTDSAETFITKYKKYCIGVTDEKFDRTYNLREYNYTLYYYDQAGNLTRTIPPQGVVPLTSSDYAAIDAYRAGTSSTPKYPQHEYATNYIYNSRNTPVSKISPDETDQTEYIYDYAGRIIFSQNAKQKTTGPYVFSYTIYDGYGRVIETGQTSASQTQLNFGTLKNSFSTNSSYFTAGYVNNIMPGVAKTEVTQTYYSVAAPPAAQAYFQGGQKHLRNRVSYIEYYTNGTTLSSASYFNYDVHGNVRAFLQYNPPLSTIGHAYKLMEYEYDLISGNMNKMTYQKGCKDQLIHQYYYDADNRLHEVLSSKNGITFDRDARYFYYKHGPLARVELGDVKVNGMDYAYTLHGWLKAMNGAVLGSATDMGKDGLESGGVSYDVTQQKLHHLFAKDAAGFLLNYYDSQTNSLEKDYVSIRSGYTINASETNLRSGTNTYFDLNTDAKNLYNGNISSMVTSYLNQDATSVVGVDAYAPQITAYKYDQLHRLRQMKAYRGITAGSSTWNTPTSANTDDSYLQQLTYDNNGNILTHLKKGASSLVASGLGGLSMDNMTYHYLQSASIRKTNRLIRINDAASSAYADDVHQTGSPAIGTPSTYNYDYDANGNLILDKAENIAEIKWTATGKVKEIIRDNQPKAGSSPAVYPPNIEYQYNALGQRSCKIVKPRTSGTAVSNQDSWIYTYYVRDAAGQVIGLYEKTYDFVSMNNFREKLITKELNLYGSSRLGVDRPGYADQGTVFTNYLFNSTTGEFGNPVYQPAAYSLSKNPPGPGTGRYLGNKAYELTNHLGNVIASISDRKIPATNSGYGSYLSNYVMATVPGTGDLFKSPNVTNGIVSAKLITYIGAGSSHYIMIRLGTALDASLCYELEFDFDKGTLAGNDLVTAYLQDVTTANHQIGYESSAIFTGIIPATGHYRFKYKPGRGGAGIMTCLVFGLTNAQSSNFLIDNVTFRALPQVTAYNPDVLSHTDYYAFGQPMPGRNWSLDEYRYGMNGQEKDNEVFKGAMAAEYWEYDSRIGRRWNMDPVIKEWESPYSVYSGNPILYTDPNGADKEDWIKNSKGESFFDERVQNQGDVNKYYNKGMSNEYTYQGESVTGAKDVFGNEFNGNSAGIKELTLPEMDIYSGKNSVQHQEAGLKWQEARHNQEEVDKNATKYFKNRELASGRLDPSISPFDFWSPANLLKRPNAVKLAGRLGNAATRNQISNIAETLEKRGWEIVGGGGKAPEEYLPGVGGGRKGSSFVDITAKKDNTLLRINTVDITKKGLPTTRELNNAMRIRSQIGDGNHLLLIPKKVE